MKKLLVLLLITLPLLFFSGLSFAVECGDNYDSGDKNQVEAIIKSCQSKIDESKATQNSLKATITLLNSKINLTQAQIKSTNVQIKQLEEEINTLSGVVAGLNSELDMLSEVLISQIRESYKNRDTDILLLFFSESFTTFQNRLKYIRTAQKRNQIIMKELESARVDYDNQKTTKEEKQAEVEKLQAQLESQKKVLGIQQSQKKQLLTDTQNSEVQYQSLLSKAQAQLAAFRRFVSSQGGATILKNQTYQSDWGTYCNQRDENWANQLIGNSDETVKNVGCLITSMAMMATHYGKSLTPGQIAASTDPFFGNTAYMIQGEWIVNGVKMNRTRIGSTTSAIDQELNEGRPVIIGIYGGPDHFLVIKKKEGDDYIMNDPFVENGHDIKFTSQYTLSAISAVDRVTVN